MSEERDQEQYAAYLAEQDAHEEALAQRAAEEEFEQQLAAAHRAGAREVCADVMRSVPLNIEGVKAMTEILARYAEPGEEEKG